MAENKYKCIAYLKCGACGYEFNAVMPNDIPPDAMGGLDGKPAKIGEPIYSFYSLACARCSRVITAIINEAEPMPDTTFSVTYPDGTEVLDAPIYQHVKPMPEDTFAY